MDDILDILNALDPVRSDNNFPYRGYRIFFRGWLCDLNSMDIIGAWVARCDAKPDSDPDYMVVSIPFGKVASHRRGSYFDKTLNVLQPSLSLVTIPIYQAYRGKALVDLLNHIDQLSLASA